MKSTISAPLLFLCLLTLPVIHANTTPPPGAGSRPNIVWLVTEDNSPGWLRLYDGGGAPMPNVERLAAGGIVFNHAFANAPVCSVARSTIISGCYAPRVGTQYHRRTDFVPMPGGLRMFPHYLRQAGYYTANNSKEDYNFIKTPTAWDESSRKASYRNRKPGQPFFHVQNFATTHEGQLHFPASDIGRVPTETDPDTVKVFPYHPDTPTFRYTYARYLDQHRKVDAQLGQFLKQLDDDGLMEETLIFYYGDHGGVLPRSKGYIYESGLQVPLVVYVPEKWTHLAPAPRGSRIDGFVSFVDLAPTVINLAGARIPEGMDGRPFLGPGVTLDELNQRDTLFSYADRFDEKYDLVRGLRKGNFKYLRSYQPFNFDGLYNQYRYRMQAYQEWRTLYREGRLNAAQRQFFEPRPAEALFDLQQDPHEVNNLAGDPAHATLLSKLRRELQAQVKSMPDLSFYPEPYFLAHGLKDPAAFGQKHKEAIGRLVDIADLSLRPFPEARTGIEAALNSTNTWDRYWGLIACSSFGKQAAPLEPRAREIAQSGEEENLVRVRAAEFLALTRTADPQTVILDCLQRAGTVTEANLILNTVVLLTDSQPGYTFDLSPVIKTAGWLPERRPRDYVADRLDYLTPP